jgi:hypothetical protein
MEVSPLIDSVWRDDELRAELPPSDEMVGTGDTKLEFDRYALGARSSFYQSTPTTGSCMSIRRSLDRKILTTRLFPVAIEKDVT